MPWIIALEAARRMEANRQMTAVRRYNKREQLKELYKYPSVKGFLAPRFLSKSSKEIEAAIKKAKRTIRNDRIKAIRNTILCVAIMSLLIYLLIKKKTAKKNFEVKNFLITIEC